MCERASYGPGPMLSLWAGRGVRNECWGEPISGETTSFFIILISMQTFRVWLSADLTSLRSNFWVFGLA